MLRKGDVITHTFHGLEESILDARGRVLPAVRKAVEQGIHFDVGHGAESFSFDITEKALQQDLLPGTISSDVHQFNVNGPAFDTWPPPTPQTPWDSPRGWARYALVLKPTGPSSRLPKEILNSWMPRERSELDTAS